WKIMMAKKLGLYAFEPRTDEALIGELLSILPLIETDMTIFYRRLADVDISVDLLADISDSAIMAPLMEAYYVPEQVTGEYKAAIGNWLRGYIARTRKDNASPETRRLEMNAVNPQYVLRNYLAQQAIDKAEAGDFSMINELLELLRHPYTEQQGKEKFAEKRPDWARHRAGCSMLSCSS
ncbi:MAG: protein adenylyltransferase SelO family protein, partial [Deltaproteobacteria bacterium]|nr:protein adenylyltransferase SelO family protein [Deltaproteobacteria bacterium]